MLVIVGHWVDIDDVCALSDVCVSHYEQLRRTFFQTRCIQTWSWEHQLKYSFVFKILRRHQEELILGL